MDVIGSRKERATYSLDPALMAELEKAVPKSKRSAFVEDAIGVALRRLERRRAVEAVQNFKAYPLQGQGAVETLRDIRKMRGEQLAVPHRKAAM